MSPYRPCNPRADHDRNYGRQWKRLSRAAIEAQPWCSYCGATDDLTGDHPIPLARGGEVLQEPVVLCRRCNGARGAD